jgi:MYXO-CTERM domain-containing protein
VVTLAMMEFGPVETDHYAYRFSWAEADGTHGESPWAVSYARAPFAQVAESYCATLEVLDLIDGQLSAHELCHPPYGNVPYGIVSASSHSGVIWGSCNVPPGSNRTCDPTSTECALPPSSILSAWCRERVAGRDCSAGAHRDEDEETCRFALAYCRENDAGVDDAGTPDAGMGGWSPFCGGSLPPCRHANEDEGGLLSLCSVSPGRKAPSPPPLMWLAIVALALGKRRGKRASGE